MKEPPKSLKEEYDLLPEKQDTWSAVRSIEDEMFEQTRIRLLNALNKHIDATIQESDGVITNEDIGRILGKTSQHTVIPTKDFLTALDVDPDIYGAWLQGDISNNIGYDDRIKILVATKALNEKDITASPVFKNLKGPIKAKLHYINEL